MGKKKGYNWKARTQIDVVLDRSEEKTLNIAIEGVHTDVGYDDSNVLALPSGKRKTTKRQEDIHKVKKLTKKERKRLEKILERKEKKAKRAEVLKSLSEHQAGQEEMGLLTSITDVQTGRMKRKLAENKDHDKTVNTICGSRKKQRKTIEEEEDKAVETDDSVATSDMSTDEEEETIEVEKKEQTKGDFSAHKGQDICNASETSTNENNRTKSSKDAMPDKANVSAGISNTLKDGLEKKNVKKNEPTKPVVNIPVNRTKEVQEARLKLPIIGEEQIIMETINENPVVVICGETGSGKTTQVPQFLYEAGYAHGKGIIGVTEPRRVAAISMSKRVAMEMNLSEREVSYQIRYEGNVTDETKIKFMTDGVLLKEIQKDFLLTHYSVIIIDEAHERSMYTDILIGLLSRIVPFRHKKGNPLKLVIMSATLRVEDFTENKRLFKETPPVLKIDSRQFPVTIHFNRRTPQDSYLHEAYRKICKIHRMLPEGGILVFVTGQQEVHTLCSKLKNTFPINKTESSSQEKRKESRRKLNKNKERSVLPNINLDNFSVAPVDEEEEEEALDSDLDLGNLEEKGSDEVESSHAGSCTEPLYMLPLYSLLPSHKQARVFEAVPSGCRLCVVSTNVAETSLTIPNIKYVVDTGKVKTKFYDKVTGVSTFKITWISQAAANQRAGRAGRVGPGHCYRLYSSAVFNEFEKFSPAEITRRPVDDLVLQMKDMNIDKVVNFPYPTAPDVEQIKAAEQLLVSLGALSAPEKIQRFRDLKRGFLHKITTLGRAMACFPVSPRYAKMLALGHQHDLLPYVVAIVSALSVQEIFVENFKPSEEHEKVEFTKKLEHMKAVKRLWAGTGHSLLLGDLMVLLKTVGACEYEGCTPKFCQKYGVRMKAMKEVRKLRAQLTNAVNSVIPNANICIDPKMSPPTDLKAKLLRQIVLAGLGDHVASRYPDVMPETNDGSEKKMKNAYQCPDLEEPVFIHPTSVLCKEKPHFVVYQNIVETSKLYMKGVVAIEPEWLPVFAPNHCIFSKPLDEPSPTFDDVKGEVMCHMKSTFGNCSWTLPAVELEYPAGIDRYKWFARFLLEGKVCPKLKKFVPDLLSAPATMVKTWSKLQPRTESLLKCLVAENVDSREALLKVWNKDTKYLLPAYCEWLPQSLHESIQQLWPPIIVGTLER
ncbi:hypothetical protein CHS0354_013106 [Potamilus streckersoni]|uniref:RNA helicase n=1 Tax=Potamilus streckersoni TaxID=2493646 RepID=A0AAE0S6N8_9BIVA|nr:hypothetical protein CHS0354_013106 [Potamilus streckersoni]